MSLVNTLKFIIKHPINRGQALRAIARYMKWQIGSRLVPGGTVYDWINGSKFLVSKGEVGLTGNIYTGLHEFSDMAFLLHVLREDDLFVDIGANVGSYTILASSAVGARGIAFEPIPDTYKRLVENVRLNHMEKKVLCINKGVGSVPGNIVFTSGGDTKNHALAVDEKNANTVSVEVTTLDAVLHDECPSMMKIDVEGYESPVLQGALETLKMDTLHSVIMELNGSGERYGFDEAKIIELMSDYGFKSYSYNPFDRELIDLKGKNPLSGNTLFIRNKLDVLERLQSSSNISVHGRKF